MNTPYTFHTRVSGIPCICRVITYYPARALVVLGPGFGDALQPEEEIFEFEILDSKGYHAPWLEKKVDEHEYAKLLEEYWTCLKEDMLMSQLSNLECI